MKNKQRIEELEAKVDALIQHVLVLQDAFTYQFDPRRRTRWGGVAHESFNEKAKN